MFDIYMEGATTVTLGQNKWLFRLTLFIQIQIVESRHTFKDYLNFFIFGKRWYVL